MATLQIPTPFRPYTNGTSVLEVQAQDVGGAITELVVQYPTLEQHLFTEDGDLRSFVNLFLNGEDVRYLNGKETQISETDKLRIIPSIAGGKETTTVDQNALKTNQVAIILLSILAFLFNIPALVAFVGFVMLWGTIKGVPGFAFLYKKVLRKYGIVKASLSPDDPASHRFAQAVGTAFLFLATFAFLINLFAVGWVLTWIVIILAAVNLVFGFCLGCTIYYWGQRIKSQNQVENPS